MDLKSIIKGKYLKCSIELIKDRAYIINEGKKIFIFAIVKYGGKIEKKKIFIRADQCMYNTLPFHIDKKLTFGKNETSVTYLFTYKWSFIDHLYVKTKHETRNTNHETRNTKHETRNTKHEPRNTKHETRNTKHEN